MRWPEPTACIGTLVQQSTVQLTPVSDTPRLDAELLLAHALEQPRSHLYGWPERIPTAAQAGWFQVLLSRRLSGEPIAYITGRREFWSLELEVSAATLIPRPETERLVELALASLPSDQPCLVADLGTGSGAIALAIAHERPLSQVIATDISLAALNVARRNAQRLGLTNVVFSAGNWCGALANRCLDLIVANPPYVATASPHLAVGDVRFEPVAALTASGGGLSALQAITTAAPAHLKSGGWLLLEHGYDQAEATLALLHAAGFDACSDHLDAAGLPRVVMGCSR